MGRGGLLDRQLQRKALDTDLSLWLLAQTDRARVWRRTDLNLDLGSAGYWL